MLLSMTGFGRAERRWDNTTITVEVRSLNSKSSDLKVRLPQRYREKEMALRSLVMGLAIRGKIEMMVEIISPEGGTDYRIHKGLFRSYYKDLRELREELGFEGGDVISAILRIQGVVDVPQGGMPDGEWNALLQATEAAMQNLDAFRKQEGAAMEADLRQQVGLIQQHLEDIAPFEQGRVEKVRQRLSQNLEDLLQNKDNIDKSRLEQELIYYLEKYDLNEEKVRLRQHCSYFLEQLDADDSQKGRKLTFIGQEMGREINTIGSKANSSDIQKFVVMMKDELEKIKEQAANVL